MILDIASLYNDFPELYDQIANDRDFFGQINDILSYANFKINLAIELCAGPARHSLALHQFNVDTYSVDISDSMRSYATNIVGIDKERYFLSNLKEDHISWGIPNNKLFDLILLMRYSAGYFSKLELYNIIRTCKNISRPGAIMIIELHDLDLIRTNLKTLDIQFREIEISDQHKVSCSWPNKNPVWDPNDWKLTMEVLIKNRQDDTEVCKLFNSQEYIHSINDIIFLCKLLSLEFKLLNDDIGMKFGNSNLVGIFFGD